MFPGEQIDTLDKNTQDNSFNKGIEINIYLRYEENLNYFYSGIKIY